MIYVVTGTDTNVGKTVLSAVLAAGFLQNDQKVAIYKPTQTGVQPNDDGDVQQIARWLGAPASLSMLEGIRLLHPMAPVDAALEEGGESLVAKLPTLTEHVRRIKALAQGHDVVIVEGAGGLLVELTAQGETIADLLALLDAELVVVTRPDLGTLNHTALTLEAASARGVKHGMLVMGSFSVVPTSLHLRNSENLARLTQRHGWAWGGWLPEKLGECGVGGGRNQTLWDAGVSMIAHLKIPIS